MRCLTWASRFQRDTPSGPAGCCVPKTAQDSGQQELILRQRSQEASKTPVCPADRAGDRGRWGERRMAREPSFTRPGLRGVRIPVSSKPVCVWSQAIIRRSASPASLHTLICRQPRGDKMLLPREMSARQQSWRQYTACSLSQGNERFLFYLPDGMPGGGWPECGGPYLSCKRGPRG